MTRFDFHTANNAEFPAVKVYREDNPSAVFALVPIEYGNTDEAERIAEIICTALNIEWKD